MHCPAGEDCLNVDVQTPTQHLRVSQAGPPKSAPGSSMILSTQGQELKLRKIPAERGCRGHWFWVQGEGDPARYCAPLPELAKVREGQARVDGPHDGGFLTAPYRRRAESSLENSLEEVYIV